MGAGRGRETGPPALDGGGTTDAPGAGARRTRGPVRRRAGYRLEVVGGELLLFDPAELTVLYCNQTAALVWGLCDGTRTVDEIVAILARVFPEAGADVAADVRRTVSRLLGHGVLEAVR